MRPRVPFQACLQAWAAPEQINDFYSTAIRGRTIAIKYPLAPPPPFFFSIYADTFDTTYLHSQEYQTRLVPRSTHSANAKVLLGRMDPQEAR